MRERKKMYKVVCFINKILRYTPKWTYLGKKLWWHGLWMPCHGTDVYPMCWRRYTFRLTENIKGVEYKSSETFGNDRFQMPPTTTTTMSGTKKKQTHRICSTITHRFGRNSENATFVCIDLNIRCTVHILFSLNSKAAHVSHDTKHNEEVSSLFDVNFTNGCKWLCDWQIRFRWIQTLAWCSYNMDGSNWELSYEYEISIQSLMWCAAKTNTEAEPPTYTERDRQREKETDGGREKKRGYEEEKCQVAHIHHMWLVFSNHKCLLPMIFHYFPSVCFTFMSFFPDSLLSSCHVDLAISVSFQLVILFLFSFISISFGHFVADGFVTEILCCS